MTNEKETDFNDSLTSQKNKADKKIGADRKSYIEFDSIRTPASCTGCVLLNVRSSRFSGSALASTTPTRT